MLARPRPPAQVRRASKESSKFSFPSDEDTNLTELLSRADGLIRERERELSFTSELSRELKQTHEALVARTPLSPFTSPSSLHTTPLTQSPPSHSRTTSTFSNTSTPFRALHALHSYQSPSISQVISPNSSFTSPTFGSFSPSPTSTRHTRRISITQSELARLSDQNAELLQKLEQLEEESASADKAGRRRLGKLEREIQVLRDELDNAKQDATTRVNKVELKKVDFRKQKIVESESISSPTFQDFAPSSSITSLSSSQNSDSSSSTYATDNATSTSSTTILHHLLSKISELEDANLQICREQRDTSGRLRDAQNQVEGMRQVWFRLGIRPGEEEENNEGQTIDVEIVADYLKDLGLEGSDGSQRTMRSLRSIGSVNLDVEGGFECGINEEMHSTLKVPLDSSSQRGQRSQLSGRLSVLTQGKTKDRKSVVGLFPTGEEEGRTSDELDISSDSLNLDAIPPIPPQFLSRRSTLNNAMFSPSDELSELDLSISLDHSRSQSFDIASDDEIISPQSESGFPREYRRRRTLGSEIGEIGDFKDVNYNPFSGSSYLRSRNNSLIQELEGNSFDSDHSEGTGTSPVIGGDLELGRDDDSDDTQKYSQFEFPSAANTPANIRITPPTPESKDPYYSSSSSSASSIQSGSTATSTSTAVFASPLHYTEMSWSKSKTKANPESVRARRISLSQSVKARVGRWGPRLSDVFHVAQSASSDQDSLKLKKLGTGSSGGARLKARTASFTRQTEQQKNPQGSLRTPSSHPLESSRGKSSRKVTSIDSRSKSNFLAVVQRPQSSSVQRVRSVVLEAWLWLQLLVVLGVFVWAVAKKGPRGVLELDNTNDNSRGERDEQGQTRVADLDDDPTEVSN
ncbi:hypothetical protein J3R30DRAFT_1682178 [Lentinula aciculospora]|uniref:Uncharacterized protein n=1 Tax=Lentinula aciculospora TaxID=153920 RepID=A0A9W8ZVP0_9AGAR|nr:hypothetical protein J3R30DRAFT_1682178 [Lentinula aciculospora]